MGTIVCQDCNEAIHYFEDEKVTTLYGTSRGQCQCPVDEE
nr:GapA-binding peptide SR1P [Bacillus subtilis]WGD63678.1 GapA-binding peptide SR1P [Bacillus subtilis]